MNNSNKNMKKSTINRVYDGNHNGRLSPSKSQF